MKSFLAGPELDTDALSFCVRVLKSGGIVCYPTETFYAIGIDPWNQEARERVYSLKGRVLEKELPLIAGDFDMVQRFFHAEDRRVVLLSQKYWPGPLTLILRTRAPRDVLLPTGAVRISSCPAARQLSLAFGSPIVSTSANQSGEPAVTMPGSLNRALAEGIDVLIDSGGTAGGEPSTILSLLDSPATILREGAVPAAQLKQYL